MGVDVWSGVLSLASAAVGGGIAYSSNYLNVRAQRAQDRRTRSDQLIDIRRTVCVTFLRRTELFLEHARELTAALDDQVVPAVLEEIHARYLEAWRRIPAVTAPVKIAGPVELTTATGAFIAALGAYADDVDRHHKSGNRPRTYNETLDAMRQAHTKFIEAAQVATDVSA
jgi:carboxypeptidase C (cathepsin A)